MPFRSSCPSQTHWPATHDSRCQIHWFTPSMNQWKKNKTPANSLVTHAWLNVKFCHTVSNVGRNMRPFGRRLEPCVTCDSVLSRSSQIRPLKHLIVSLHLYTVFPTKLVGLHSFLLQTSQLTEKHLLTPVLLPTGKEVRLLFLSEVLHWESLTFHVTNAQTVKTEETTVDPLQNKRLWHGR